MTRVFSGVAVVLVLAAFFGLVAAAVLQTAQMLPGDVRMTLRRGLHVGPPEAEDRSDGGMDLTIVDGPPRGAARGVQLVLFGVLTGGLPMALTGMGLGWYSRVHQRVWSDGWAHVFLGGFVFQLSSLCVAALVFIVLLSEIIDLGAVAPSEAAFGGALLTSIGCSALALRSWLTLLHSASDRPIHVVP